MITFPRSRQHSIALDSLWKAESYLAYELKIAKIYQIGMSDIRSQDIEMLQKKNVLGIPLGRWVLNVGASNVSSHFVLYFLVNAIWDVIFCFSIFFSMETNWFDFFNWIPYRYCAHNKIVSRTTTVVFAETLRRSPVTMPNRTTWI